MAATAPELEAWPLWGLSNPTSNATCQAVGYRPDHDAEACIHRPGWGSRRGADEEEVA